LTGGDAWIDADASYDGERRGLEGATR